MDGSMQAREECAPRILVVTGLSGSGKSTALRALEDSGYFCIDNLPVPLLGKLVELAEQAGDMSRIAVVVDAREGRFLGDLPKAISDLRKRAARVEVLYLDAADEVLIRRYSETRRRHPLSPDGSVVGGIAEERRVLRELRDLADEAVETSSLTVHDLKGLIQARFGSESTELSVALLSFGKSFGEGGAVTVPSTTAGRRTAHLGQFGQSAEGARFQTPYPV